MMTTLFLDDENDIEEQDGGDDDGDDDANDNVVVMTMSMVVMTMTMVVMTMTMVMMTMTMVVMAMTMVVMTWVVEQEVEHCWELTVWHSSSSTVEQTWNIQSFFPSKYDVEVGDDQDDDDLKVPVH